MPNESESPPARVVGATDVDSPQNKQTDLESAEDFEETDPCVGGNKPGVAKQQQSQPVQSSVCRVGLPICALFAGAVLGAVLLSVFGVRGEQLPMSRRSGAIHVSHRTTSSSITKSMIVAQELPHCWTRKVLEQVIQEPCSPFTDSDPSPRILVTGGAGFVGGHLIHSLRSQGMKSIKVVDNLWRGRLSNLCDVSCDCIIDMSRDFCFADLTDASAIGNMFEGVDLVYHLADVVAGIGFVFDHQPWLFRQNILININVMNAVMDSTTVKDYIYVGTACSFPLELQSSYDFIALRENQTYPAHPESAYGWSKLMGEYEGQLVTEGRTKSNHPVNIGMLRFHNLYGPRSPYADKEGSQALPALIRKAVHYPKLETYELWGSGKQYRDFLYVDDAVSGLLAMYKHGMNQGVVQIGTGVPTTLLESAQIIKRLTELCLGKTLDLKTNSSRREGDMGRVGQLDRAKSILKWEAKVSAKEGLARMYAWIIGDMRTRGKLEDWMFGEGKTAKQVQSCLESQADLAQSYEKENGPNRPLVRVPDGLKVWR